MASHLADARTALYRLYDADNQLLYIGITHNPEQRWTGHAFDKPWWPDVARKDLEWYDNRALAEAAEVAAIRTERTLYNVDDSPWAPKPRELEANEVSITEAKQNLTHVIRSVELLRRTYFLAARSKRKAALVPVDLGELIEQAGGPDKAAAILAAHLAGEAG